MFRSKQRKTQYLKQKILHADFNSDAIHMQVRSHLTDIISTHAIGRREIERERGRERKHGKKRLLRFHQYRKRTVTDVMEGNNDESTFKKKQTHRFFFIAMSKYVNIT